MIVMIALGIAAGVTSVLYWRFYTTELDRVLYDAGTDSTEIAPANDQALADLSQRVNRALEAGTPERIQKDVEIFAIQHPHQSDAQTLLGQVLLYQGDLAGSYTQFKTSLSINNAQPEVHLLAGSICMQLDQHDQAEVHYRNAINLDPSNHRFRLHLAACYTSQKRLDDARILLMSLVNQDSSAHDAYAMLSKLYYTQNKLDMAMTQITKALDSIPISNRQQAIIYVRHMAAILRRMNKPGEALQVLESKLTETERSDPVVIDDMAMCFSMQNQFEAAALLFEEALQTSPTNWRLAANAVRWWHKAGESGKARLGIDRIRKIAPNSPAAPLLESMLNQSPASVHQEEVDH